MLWEKKTSVSQKNGYLYIRETIYERDGRTKKRKPSKLCDGSATKERGKYSKKKDIYCGKITPAELKNLISFENYITENKKIEFFKYKIDSSFEDIVDDYYDYLLFIHDISHKDFFSGKKAAYNLGSGFLSREGILWLKRFNWKNDSQRELERFSNRCQDAGILEAQVIVLLHAKVSEREGKAKGTEEKLKETEHYEGKYSDFIKKQYSG